MLFNTPSGEDNRLFWDGQGDVWSPFKMEVVVDGVVSDTLQLTFNDEYNVDGDGNLTFFGPFIANTPTFTVDGTEYKITWWISGSGGNHVIISSVEHPEQDPVAI